MDVFASVNLMFFLWMCDAAYLDRFIHFRGRENLWEFFVYASVIMALIVLAWRVARQLPVPIVLLVLAQIGIFLHFSGGLALLNENRLYDKVIFGIRYDKYVHCVNAMLAACFTQRIPWQRIIERRWLCDLLVLVVVLGLGAFVEVVEYLVTLTIEVNGVGGYHNNMQDLIANLVGASLCIGVHRVGWLHKANSSS
jgi:hypothetical protein